LLAIGVVVALAIDERGPWAVGRGPWGDIARKALAVAPYLGLQALALGALACTNSWDVPTYLLVTAAGLFHAAALRGRDDGEGIAGRLVVAGAGAVLTGLVAYALYLPFF